MIAGIGCRAGVSGEQVEAAIRAAVEALSVKTKLTAIATPAAKATQPGIVAAAAARGVPLLAITQTQLEAADAATVTRSARAVAAMNVHCVAEAAALAGAAALRYDVDAAPAQREIAAAMAANRAEVTTANGQDRPAAFPALLLPRITVGPVTCALASAPTL